MDSYLLGRLRLRLDVPHTTRLAARTRLLGRRGRSSLFGRRLGLDYDRLDVHERLVEEIIVEVVVKVVLACEGRQSIVDIALERKDELSATEPPLNASSSLDLALTLALTLGLTSTGERDTSIFTSRAKDLQHTIVV